MHAVTGSTMQNRASLVWKLLLAAAIAVVGLCGLLAQPAQALPADDEEFESQPAEGQAADDQQVGDLQFELQLTDDQPVGDLQYEYQLTDDQQSDDQSGKDQDSQEAKWYRLAGDNRLGTMAAVAQAGLMQADTVLLTTGWTDADALAAAGISGVLQAPIITTAPDELSMQAASEIDRLEAKNVIILGGANAVSDEVKKQLEDDGLAVSRIAGETRVDTAVAIYAEAIALSDGLDSPWGDTCILSKGWVSADALAAGSFAYANKAPIFLANADGTVSETTMSAIKNFDNVLILGGIEGDGAIANSTIDKLGVTPLRVAGDTRYETAIQLATWTTGADELAVFQPAVELGWDNLAIAYAWNYPDALVGVDVTGPNKSVTLLVNTTIDDGTQLVSQEVDKHRSSIKTGYILGGTSVISGATRELFDLRIAQKHADAVKEALDQGQQVFSGTVRIMPTQQAVEANPLNQTRIDFDHLLDGWPTADEFEFVMLELDEMVNVTTDESYEPMTITTDRFILAQASDFIGYDALYEWQWLEGRRVTVAGLLYYFHDVTGLVAPVGIGPVELLYADE